MKTSTIDFTPLLVKWPPKHETPHRPKRRVPNTVAFTVLDRLPSQGVTDWKKQDSITNVGFTTGLNGPVPTRGVTVANKKKAKK